MLARRRVCPLQVRQSKYDFDENELKPYLSLPSVTAAAFDVSAKLYGLPAKSARDSPRTHSH